MTNKKELSTLSLAVLGLIAQKPQTGYDLRKVFSTTPMGHFSSSPGAIYPALDRIEKCGWVKGSIDAENALRPKKVYRITEKGLDVLSQHLMHPVTKDDVIWQMDELMLRFAFMDQVISRPQIIQFLNEFLSAVEEYLASLRKSLNELRSNMSLCGQLALEKGIQDYEISSKWAQQAIKKLGKKDF